ncbi:hypothetical protein JL101_020895 [Skermanella rosea]|uniref:hypothetical protein n=1 Tax=Skermanella rosea TaxID=1817965 RepID=UPI001933BCAC|nr:hypothetical protein [Skermanella rosea]UEM02432.1 hypothetical protein JL101_020895 [Skermanella rosea]
MDTRVRTKSIRYRVKDAEGRSGREPEARRGARRIGAFLGSSFACESSPESAEGGR